MPDALPPRLRQRVDLAELARGIRIPAREASDEREHGAVLLEDEDVALGIRERALPHGLPARDVDPCEPFGTEDVLVRRLPRACVHRRDRGSVLLRGAPNRYLPADAETYLA